MKQARALAVQQRINKWVEKFEQGFSLEHCQRCGSIELITGKYICPICGRSKYHNDIVHKQCFDIERIAEGEV